MENNLDEFRNIISEASKKGGVAAEEKQHQQGKLTARDRISLLLDENTFSELGLLMESRSSDFGMDSKRSQGDGVRLCSQAVPCGPHQAPLTLIVDLTNHPASVIPPPPPSRR